MYFRNFDPTPVTEVDYSGLKREGNYFLPHVFKYVAWFIVAATVVSSSVVLILYGISFGMVKSYLWLTAFISSFFIGAFISVPIRIFVTSIIRSICLKKKPMIIKRQIDPLLLLNPADPVKKMQVLKFREYNDRLYRPTPLHKLESRLEDIKYNLELRNLTTDLAVYIMFVIAAFYIVLFNKTPMAFYSNEIIFEVILNGSYTNTIPFDNVNTYDTFLKYLNETLLPSLLVNGMGHFSKRLNAPQRGTKRAWDKDFTLRNTPPKKRQILEDFKNVGGRESKGRRDIFSRGWTMNPNFKLMGKPRLRQVRVQTGLCRELINLQARNIECAPDLTLINVETGDFGLSWGPLPPKGLTEAQASPWRYWSAWKTGSLPTFAKFSSYPAGGYVLNLARNIDDARTILEFLDAFQWVDMRTRAVFIEFTLYCVNTNLFSVVLLIAERSANGYFIPSYETKTCKFLILDSEFEFMVLTMTVIFGLLVFFFLLRESLRIHRTSFRLYLCRGMAILDLVIVLFGILSVVFVIVRSVYVSDLLKRLEESENNEFVSFAYAACWHTWSIYIEAILLCLACFKLLRLLTFRVVFFQLQRTLTQCFRRFVDLVFQQLVLIIAFAFFFNLTLVYYSEGFSNFGLALSTMIGRTVAVDNSYDYSILNSPWYIGPLFFSLFAVIVCILFVNIFIAVICLYFHKVRETHLVDKYNLSDYLKHSFTLKRQRDILRLKEDGAFPKHFLQMPETDVIRLKGGGNKASKGKKRKTHEEETEVRPETEEIMKVYLKDFVRKKMFDTTEYKDLAVDRLAALKHMMILFLTENEEVRKMSCENSLRVLFWSFTSNRRNLDQRPGEYFFVRKKSGVDILDKRAFIKMRRIVEDLGREKGLIIEEDECGEEDMTSYEDKIVLLDGKLCLLLEKLSK